MNPSVSVILPTHNRARQLPRAIASVLAQSWRDYELIVVDDASTDRTPELVAGYRDERIRYLRLDQNAGPAVARNRAIAEARGQWLAFQDSDDEWLAGKLDAQMAYAQILASDHVGIGSLLLRVVGSTVERVEWPLVKSESQHPPAAYAQGPVDREEFVAGAMAYLQSLLLRRSAVLQVGGFDETLAARSDIELCLRLLAVGRFAAVDTPTVLSIETPGSVSLQLQRRIAATRTIMRRHAALIAPAPRAAASWNYDIGRAELLIGDRRAACVSLLRALRAQPKSLRAWALLCLAPLPRAWLTALVGVVQRRRRGCAGMPGRA